MEQDTAAGLNVACSNQVRDHDSTFLVSVMGHGADNTQRTTLRGKHCLLLKSRKDATTENI